MAFTERRRFLGYAPCAQSTGQGNDSELIPAAKMETRGIT